MNLLKRERITGGILGLLIGDALGVPYEFHDANEIPAFDKIEFEPPVGFNRAHLGVPAGTWSDDGAQALILLDTLLTCDRLDVKHFADGLVKWYDEGFYAVDNRVFDVGIQTGKAIYQLKDGVSALNAGGIDEFSNGNGSLMRVLPLALWHKGSDVELIADAELQSIVTHRHLRSQICCALYCLWARNELNVVENAFDVAVETLRDIYASNEAKTVELEAQIKPDDVHEPRGNGYVVDSLFSARWACGNKDYESTVKAAISLGDDTDTTACIAGGIAGIKFGVNSIPSRWREGLRGRDVYGSLLDELLKKLDIT
ncbi:MAG: ADP-ribosylglycohydrolase family protein [Pyrinomonadaceae bacterium]|nr:ADP-ribosylglycohydrolase family protein [Pyrinomonadaceae bacterium]